MSRLAEEDETAKTPRTYPCTQGVLVESAFILFLNPPHIVLTCASGWIKQIDWTYSET